MPTRRQCSGLSLAIADDTRHDQVRIVKRCPICMREGIPELSSFVDQGVSTPFQTLSRLRLSTLQRYMAGSKQPEDGQG